MRTSVCLKQACDTLCAVSPASWQSTRITLYSRGLVHGAGYMSVEEGTGLLDKVPKKSLESILKEINPEHSL